MIQQALEYLLSRRGAYQAVFSGARAPVVLQDLAQFCRANASTGHVDPYVSARLDGRREVWLRIQHHLKLSDDELWKLYTKG